MKVMFFCLFFWNLNVIDTVSSNLTKLLVLSVISTLFLKKRTVATFSLFVLRVPVTWRYSQLLILKKNTQQASWPSASSLGVKLFSNNLTKTETGKAFCCFVDGSTSIYPRICCCKNSEGMASASRSGSYRRLTRKVERTFVMVSLTVLPLRADFFVLP